MTQINLLTLCRYWEAAKSGRGHKKHATYTILLASYTVNTGDSPMNAKNSGK